MRFCSKCKQEFKQPQSNGYCSYCQHLYYLSHKNKQRTYRSRWKKEHPKQNCESSKKQYGKKYGITQLEYSNYMNSANTCNICSCNFITNKEKHLDHDHSNNTVRGVLCRSCNLGLGQFKDNSNILHLAIQYLNRLKDVAE